MRKKTQILFASGNKDKYAELKGYFADCGIDLVFPKQKLDLKEDEETLTENASAKAVQACQQTGMISLGDDSGLFVEELDYFPGIHSRRWMDGTDKNRAGAVFDMMMGKKNRTAWLISEFALAVPNPDHTVDVYTGFRTKNRFIISDKYEEDSGSFGYDDIMIPDMIVEAAQAVHACETENGIVAEYGRYHAWQGIGFAKKRLNLIERCRNNGIPIGRLSEKEKIIVKDRGWFAIGIKQILDGSFTELGKEEIKWPEKAERK